MTRFFSHFPDNCQIM